MLQTNDRELYRDRDRATVLHAANELTCLVLRTRPWLLQETEFITFKGAIGNLTTAINTFDALYQQQVEQANDKKKFLKDTKYYRSMLYNARQTMRKGHTFKGDARF